MDALSGLVNLESGLSEAPPITEAQDQSGIQQLTTLSLELM